jgi:hypothetical protein
VLSTCQLKNFRFSLTTANLAKSVGLGKTNDPTENRTPISTVKGWRTSRYTMGPKAKAEGIEPSSTVLETVILPLNYANIHNSNVSLRTARLGFEPRTYKLTVCRTTVVLSGIINSGARIRTQTKRTKISSATVTLPRRADERI